MKGEGDIVELDRGGQAFVAGCVLGANQGRIDKGDVGDGVGEEAYHGVRKRWICTVTR